MVADYGAAHDNPSAGMVLSTENTGLGAATSEASSAIRARSRRRHGKENGVIGQASWLSSVVNILNTIVGAGTLAMPQAMSRMGMLLGVLTILWSGLASGFGLYLQTRCAKYLDRGSASFFAVSQMTYPNISVVFDAAIAIKCFGVGISYLIIIGDLMPGVVLGFTESAMDVPFLMDRRFWITAFMLIIIPLSFLRRLDSLKYTSVIALISISYLVVLVVYHFGIGDVVAERGTIRYIEPQGLVPYLSSFPVVVFGFTCHQNMFSVLNEISDNSDRNTSSVVVSSIGTAALTYILVAITGYLSFGNNVDSNIIGMYPTSVSATIGKFAIVILVMFSFPLQAHPCRASVDSVLKWRPVKSGEVGPARGPLLPGGKSTDKKNEGIPETRFAVITTILIVLSYLTAISVKSLAAVLAYVGSTGSTSISFILPGILYYSVSSPDSPHHQRLMKEDDDEEVEGDLAEGEGLLSGNSLAQGWVKLSWTKGLTRRLALALVIYGLCVMVVCLTTTMLFHVTH